MFELYIRKRHFRSTYIQRKCSSQFPASRLKSVDTIGSYCEITRAMRPYFHARCANTTEIYGGGGGGEEEKNSSFEYKNVRNVLQ